METSDTLYLVTLHKILSEHDNVRGDYVPGYVFELPKVGNCLCVIGEPLHGVGRTLITSRVEDVRISGNHELYMIFRTRNSTYELYLDGEVWP